MINILKKSVTIALIALSLTHSLSAETPPSTNSEAVLAEVSALRKRLAELEATIRLQDTKISSIQANSSVAAAPRLSPVSKSTSSTSPVAQFNPDIGVVGDIVGKLSNSDTDEEGNDRFSVRELEVILGHEIDPYSRFDATIAFSDFEDPHVEEGYVTYWGLPYETRAKLGRFHPKIGIASSQHRDELDSVDEPLVVARYLGEEGLSKTGLEVSNFIPFSWDSPTLELTAGLSEGGVGHGAELLSENRRNPVGYLRARSSFELNGEDSFDLGSTLMSGSADDDTSHEVQMYGLDLKYIHHISGTSRLKIQGEAFFQDRSLPGVEEEEGSHAHNQDLDDHHEEDHEDEHGEDEHEEGDEEVVDSPQTSFNRSPFGYYLLADLRANERWSFGARYDYVESSTENSFATNPSDKAYSAILTYHQSEFARWRFQYQRLDSKFEEDDDVFMLQGLFAIGNHKHNIQ